MKQLKCEVCGSNELTEVDGFYVCDYCRTKFPKEEFLSDSKISGGNGLTDELQGLLQSSIDAFRDEMFVESEKKADEILIKSPNLPDALFLKAILLKIKGDKRFERYVSRARSSTIPSYGLYTEQDFIDDLGPEILIYNCTENPVRVLIDGNRYVYSLEADEYSEINVSPSLHNIRVFDMESRRIMADSDVDLSIYKKLELVKRRRLIQSHIKILTK